MPIFRGKSIVSPVSDYKDSVRVASRTNILLTDDVLSVDQVALNDLDRVLLVGQSNLSQNGIYTWSADTNKLVRATDADSAFELSAGVRVYVEEGLYNKQTVWVLTTPGIIQPGVTNITFVKEHNVGTASFAGTYGDSKKTLSVEVDDTGAIASITEVDIDVDGGFF